MREFRVVWRTASEAGVKFVRRWWSPAPHEFCSGPRRHRSTARSRSVGRFALSRGFRIGMFRGHTAMVVGFRRTEPAERRCEPAFTRSLDALNALGFDSDLFIPARLAGVWRN